MELFHEKVAIPLLMVGFLEGRIFLERKLVIFFCSLEFHQFDIDLPNVAVKFSIIGVSSDCLLVLFKSLREFT